MISVEIYKNRNEEYAGFKCSGHAGYAKRGKDIICAAMSMLVINTINSIETLTDCTIEATSEEESGTIIVNFPNGLSKEALLLMNSMILGIKEVVNGAGKSFVTLDFKEV